MACFIFLRYILLFLFYVAVGTAGVVHRVGDAVHTAMGPGTVLQESRPGDGFLVIQLPWATMATLPLAARCRDLQRRWL